MSNGRLVRIGAHHRENTLARVSHDRGSAWDLEKTTNHLALLLVQCTERDLVTPSLVGSARVDSDAETFSRRRVGGFDDLDDPAAVDAGHRRLGPVRQRGTERVH